MMKKVKSALISAIIAGLSFVANAWEQSDVPKQPDLPEGYTLAKYIVACGSEYIDTGITMQDKIGFDVLLKPMVIGGGGNYVLAAYTSSSVEYLLNVFGTSWRGRMSGEDRFHYYDNVPAAGVGVKAHVRTVISGNTQTMEVDGVQESNTCSATQKSSTAKLWLLANADYERATNPFIGYLYYAKIYTGATDLETGTLARNYIPCRRDSDGVFGLYETVEGKFKVPATSGCAFGGKLATSVELPSQYGEVEYVECPWTAADTGLTWQDQLAIDVQFTWKSLKGTGAKASSDTYAGVFGASSSSRAFGYTNSGATWYGGGNSFGKGNAAANMYYSVYEYLDGANFTFSLNGAAAVTKSSTDSKVKTYGDVCYLGNFFFGDNGAGLRDTVIFSAKIYTDKATLARDYVPVYNYETKQYGFYDLLGSGFITSANDTPFTGPTLPPRFTVTFADRGYATVTATVNGEAIESGTWIDKGAEVVVVATPAEHYEYATLPEGWEQVEDSSAITRTYTVGSEALEITAPDPTEIPQFTVTALSCENGSITGAGTYYRDEVATLTATPDEGYAFKAWTDAAEGQEGAVIELTITANIEVGATFEKLAADKRLVTYTGGENTSYTVKSDDEEVLTGSTVDVGATIVAVVKPNEHYAFITPIPEGWVAGEEPGSLTKSFKADEDVTFEIPSAELITFVLAITQPEHGTISGTEPGTLTEGDAVELSVEFDGGVYQFVNWTTNGAPAGTETTLSFTMQDNMSVTAVIEKIPPVELKINNDATKQTFVATANGEEVSAGAMLDWNATVTIVATSQFGYKYLSIPEGWSKGTEPRSIIRNFTVNTRPLEITIPDAEGVTVYSLSVTQPENGEIWGAEVGPYETGDQVKLTATPSEVGYYLANWVVNGEDAGAANPLSITLDADTTVEAVFAEVKIPRPYIRVEYISTTADGKQFIDTGVGMQNKLRVEFDFKLNSIAGSGGYLMARYNTSSSRQYVLNVSGGKKWLGGVDANAQHEFSTLDSAKVGVRYKAESLFDDKVHTLTINGWPESFTGTIKTADSSSLYLLNHYYTTSSSGYPADATLYSCRMFTGASSTNPGLMVREFLPVYNRDTKKYGLYDTVNGKFYPSKTADFIGAKVPMGLAFMFY